MIHEYCPECSTYLGLSEFTECPECGARFGSAYDRGDDDLDDDDYDDDDDGERRGAMAFCSACGGDGGTGAFCPRCGTAQASGPTLPPPNVGPQSPPPPPPGGYRPPAPTGFPPSTYPGGPQPSGKKVAAGVCGILLGALGIHKFVLGYTAEGIIMLVLGLVSCGLITSIIGLVEGIIYLTKSDAEFDATYVYNKRGWF